MNSLRALDTPLLYSALLPLQTASSSTGRRALPELKPAVQSLEGERFFQDHPALASFFDSLDSAYKHPALNRAVKALHVIASKPDFFTKERIDDLVNYYTVPTSPRIRFTQRKASEGLMTFHDGSWLRVPQGCFLTQNADFRVIRSQLAKALHAFWQTELTSLPVNTRSSSIQVSPEFGRVRPRDTEWLLDKKHVFEGPTKPKASSPEVRIPFETHVIKMVESQGKCEDLPWDTHETFAGLLLSVPGSADLSTATDIHVVHASRLQRGHLCLPPSGEVILAVTPSEYRTCYQSLFELAETNKRVRVFVARIDDPSQVARRRHTAMWAIDMLQHALGEKRLYMLEDNVKCLGGDVLDHHAGRNTIQVGVRYSALPTAGNSPGSFQCAVWHFPEPESARAPLTAALDALRFLPTDFDGAAAFLHFCLQKSGMGMEALDARQFAWEEDRSGLSPGGNGTGTFEKTYGDPQRLEGIKRNIQESEYLRGEQKKRVSELCEAFFNLKVTAYREQMKETWRQLSKLPDGGVDDGRVGFLKGKLAGSAIRQGLYDVMNCFTASEKDRILFVTAPCGVGKTLALSLLSVRREGRSAWFSFPTNQLAIEFQQAAPSRNLSVHCQGDVKGWELGTLEQHGARLETAVFVHPTLLHAVGKQLAPSTAEGLTLFIDEWHNLSDFQLENLSEFLKKTSVKLVLLSATPREEPAKRLKCLYEGLHRTHEISVDAAVCEGLLRPRLFFDGTDSSHVYECSQMVMSSIKKNPNISLKEIESLVRFDAPKTDFALRLVRALTALDASIHGKLLWEHSGVIYLDNIKKAEQVCAALREKYPTLTVYNVTGSNPVVPDFEARPFALVCCKRFKEGANIKALGYVMTLASLTDTDAIQIGGRLSRKSDRKDELPYGLFFAFGDGSSRKHSLRSDPAGEDLQAFLQDCCAPDKQNLTRYWPLMPAVTDIFPPEQDPPSRIRIHTGLLQDHTKYNDRNSIHFLTRKRLRTEEPTP